MHTIRLKSIWFRNLYSYGDQLTEYKFTPGMTWIQGQNGAGKSSLIEAISLLWFNEPYRPVVKENIKNTANPKGTLIIGGVFEREEGDVVDVYEMTREFTSKGSTKKLTVRKNGVEEMQNAGTYQKTFEDTVLGFGQTLFNYVISINIESTTPYLELKTAKRREILESLLAMGIDKLKEKGNERKKDAKVRLEIAKGNVIHMEKEIERLGALIATLETETVERKAALERAIAADGEAKAAISAEIASQNALFGEVVESGKAFKAQLDTLGAAGDAGALSTALAALDRMPALDKDLLDKDGHIANARKALEAAKKRLTETDAANCDSLLAELGAQIRDLNATMADLSEAGRLSEAVATLESGDAKSVRDALDRIDGELGELFAKAKCGAANEIDDKFAKMQTELNKIDAGLGTESFKLTDIAKKIANLKAHKDSIKEGDKCKLCGRANTAEEVATTHKSCDEQIEELAKQQTQCNEQIATLTARKAKGEAFMSEFGDIKRRTAELNSRRALEANRLERANAELSAAKAKLSDIRARQGAYAGDKAAIEALKATAQSALDAATRRVGELEAGKKQYEALKADAAAKSNDVDYWVKSRESVVAERDRCMSAVGGRSRDALQAELDKCNEIERRRGQLNAEIATLRERANSVKAIIAAKSAESAKCDERIASANAEIAKLGTGDSLAQTKASLADARKNLADAELAIKTHSDDVAILEYIVNGIASDDGIKKLVLARYVPAFNQAVARNLQSFGLPCAIEFDDSMEYSYISRPDKAPSYANLSQGQRRKLNFAISMAFRDFVAGIASFRMNALFIDECLDTGTDDEVYRELAQMLVRSVTPDMSLNVVTHRGNSILNMFSAIARVEHDGRYSALKVLSPSEYIRLQNGFEEAATPSQETAAVAAEKPAKKASKKKTAGLL